LGARRIQNPPEIVQEKKWGEIKELLQTAKRRKIKEKRLQNGIAGEVRRTQVMCGGKEVLTAQAETKHAATSLTKTEERPRSKLGLSGSSNIVYGGKTGSVNQLRKIREKTERKRKIQRLGPLRYNWTTLPQSKGS